MRVRVWPIANWINSQVKIFYFYLKDLRITDPGRSHHYGFFVYLKVLRVTRHVYRITHQGLSHKLHSQLSPTWTIAYTVLEFLTFPNFSALIRRNTRKEVRRWVWIIAMMKQWRFNRKRK